MAGKKLSLDRLLGSVKNSLKNGLHRLATYSSYGNPDASAFSVFMGGAMEGTLYGVPATLITAAATNSSPYSALCLSSILVVPVFRVMHYTWDKYKVARESHCTMPKKKAVGA